MLKLAVFLKKYKKECIIGPMFKFFEAVLELLLPTIMAVIINDGVDSRNINVVLRLGGLMAGLACLGYGCALVCQFLASRASQGVGTDLRNAVFEKISGFSYSQADTFGAPTLINRITNDVNQLQQWVAMMIRLLIRAPFICIGAMVMAVILDIKLSLILFAAIPVLAVIIYFVTAKTAPLYRGYQKNLDGLGNVLRESLSGARVIRAFSKTDAERKHFAGANSALTNNGLDIGNVTALFNPLTALVVNVAIIAILWAGGWQISLGSLRQGQVIAYISYVNQILYALLVVSNLIVLLTKSMASAARINEILDTPCELADAPDAKAPEILSDVPAVAFSHVSFGYNATGEKAVEDIDVRVGKGETIGVIGGTGSGKSTFVNLIPRFYDADSGAVELFGKNVKEIPAADLRKLIGVVPQKAVLFTGTVAENIRWGNPDASDEEVVRAADTAQASEFITGLDGGYDAKIERGGSNLSGGQRQRLTIARALAEKPEILVLDDSSSALDFATDAKLRAALRNDCSGMTVFIVSQRVGAVRSADRILVFDNGRICGEGTHEQLVKSCEAYREICLSQLSSEEAGI